MHILSSIAMTTVLLVVATGSPQGRTSGSQAGLEALGESLSAYLGARTNALGVDEARAAVATCLASLREASGGADPLGEVGTLEHALRSARSYDALKHERGRVESDVFRRGSFGAAGLEVTYRLPKEYDPEHTDHALILAVPDVGETPAEHIRSHWMARDVRQQAIVVSVAMPAEVEGWERVMIRGRPGGLAHVLTALRFATERFAVDPERVFVAGRGASVPVAMATGNHAPERFAGIVGRAGDASDLGPGNFRNLPTCFAEAGERASAFRDTASEMGHANVTLLSRDDDQAIWHWMLEHPRVTFPTAVRLETGDPFPTRVAWLRVAPSAPGANASAEIDRKQNRVAVTTEGVSHVTLYLNDALADLDRPLRFVSNGHEASAVVERSLVDTLDMLYDGTSDPACVYVARAVFDVTGEQGRAGEEGAGEEDPEYTERLSAAGSEAVELWRLYEWCGSSGRAARGQTVLRKLLRLHPDHAQARSAMGHSGEPGRWFASEEAFERYRDSQDETFASAKGHVLNKGVWIHRDERSLANKNWVKDFASGQWLSRSDVRRLEQGWARQDLAWIPPQEAAHVDQGLWWLHGEWIGLADANRRHARIDSMWRIPCGAVLLYTTLDREVALRAAEHMGRAIRDLRKVFGAEPVLPLSVALLRDEEQYDRFAFGDPDGRRLPTHTARLHVIHSAFFAESWFERVEGQLEFLGMGVGIWDTNAPNGDLFGVHAARLAVGLSYADALDPSPKTVRKALSRGLSSSYYEDYQAEKRLPPWLRYGGAVYAERTFEDRAVAAGSDPWWARRWSLDNLKRQGGLRELEELFAFELDPENREDAQKLLLEVGLLVAFVVDGECAPVKEKHEAFKQAMVSGTLHPRHIRELKQAVLDHRDELRAFTGGS